MGVVVLGFNSMKTKILGYCAVDSGQLLVVDPCYLNKWESGEYDEKDKHYRRVCDKSGEGGGEILISGIGGNGVVFPSGCGDGVYPVTAHYNKEGRIKHIVIDFLDEE